MIGILVPKTRKYLVLERSVRPFNFFYPRILVLLNFRALILLGDLFFGFYRIK